MEATKASALNFPTRWKIDPGSPRVEDEGHHEAALYGKLDPAAGGV